MKAPVAKAAMRGMAGGAGLRRGLAGPSPMAATLPGAPGAASGSSQPVAPTQASPGGFAKGGKVKGKAKRRGK